MGDAYNSTQRDINVMPITHIVFNDAYQKDLRRKIKIVVDRLLIEERDKILIENKAIELFDIAIKNGMTAQNLDYKSSGILSIIFTYYSLLFYDYFWINENHLTYSYVCRLIKDKMSLFGLKNCKTRGLGTISQFLPEDLKIRYLKYRSAEKTYPRVRFNENYEAKLKEYINITLEYIRLNNLEKESIRAKAWELYHYAREIEMEPHDLGDNKSPGYFALVLVYYSMLLLGIDKINDTKIYASYICRLLGNNLRLIGIRREIERACSHLPSNNFRRFLSEENLELVNSLRPTKYTYEILKNLSERVGHLRSGQKGYLLTSEEKFNELIMNKNPTEVILKWWCGKEKHSPWRAIVRNVVNRKWCYLCGREAVRKKYDELVKLAKSRGMAESGKEGKLITTQEEFKKLTEHQFSSRLKLKWECGEGHQWESIYPNIEKSWCPYCSEGKYEKIIRWYFEKLFNAKFFLRIPLNKVIKDTYDAFRYGLFSKEEFDNLMTYSHFDIYGELTIKGNLYKIAGEFNGPQHYDFPNYIHGTDLARFQAQQRRDLLKREISNHNNIILIEFPYFFDPHLDHPKKIQNRIISEFKKISRLDFKVQKWYYHKSPKKPIRKLDNF